MNQDMAETVGLRALAWLVGNEELLPVFLGSTGSSLEQVKCGAQDIVFIASVLDFILLDDAWILALSEDLDLSPQAVSQARSVLPGGAEINWT